MLVVATSARWWKAEGDALAKQLGTVFSSVVEQSAWLRDAHKYHASLWGGEAAGGSLIGQTGRDYASYAPSTLPDNVCRSLVDTLQAKIGKHRPLPKALTSRGEWKKQRRAKKLTQFIEGAFYKHKIFERHGPNIIRDAAIFGVGHMAVMVQGKSLRVERVIPTELFVDEWDARYGDPRNLYRCRTVDSGVLLELFGRTDKGAIRASVRDAIAHAKNTRWIDTDENRGTHEDTTDRVDVLEAWHLCDNVEAHETGEKHKCTGRHVVAIADAVLVDEEYDWDAFPIATLHYCEPLTGFWGTGLVEQIEGYQYELNCANEKLSEMHRLSGSLVVVPDGGDVSATELNNDVGTILHTTPGVGEPKVWQMDLVSQTLAARVPELAQRAMNNSGISQMSAQSAKPSGISSGVALQTLDDVETERFIIFGRQYEAWCLDMSRLFVCGAKQIAATHGDYAVGVPMRAGLINLSWKDVEIDGYELRIFPTSELSTKPAAQLEKMEQWFNVGLFDGDTLWRLSDNPDVQAELELRIADKMVIDDMLEHMLDADEDDEDAYLAPTPYQDYEWAKRRAQQKLNRAVLDGAPEFNQQQLRDFITDCEGELEKLKPPPAPPMAPPMGPPGMGAPPMDPSMGAPPPMDPSMPPVPVAA